jgi:hypothetical protein
VDVALEIDRESVTPSHHLGVGHLDISPAVSSTPL